MDMTISQLLKYLEDLETFDLALARQHIQNDLYPSIQALEHRPFDFAPAVDRLTVKYNKVADSILRFNQSIIDLQNHIKSHIERLEPDYLRASTELYQEMVNNDSDEHILQRTLQLSPEIHEVVKTRVCLYSDWHYPGLVVRPLSEPWISSMVSLDPLYAWDESEALLAPLSQRFNRAYMNRLCLLIGNKRRESDMLEGVPDRQLAYTLIYNFFHYRPLEYITRFITELYHKLRPGGTVAMTVNDCDRSGGVCLTERKFACYTPISKIKAAAETIGYKTVFSCSINNAVTWLEIQRPGTLTSLRGGQALAKLIAKS